MSKLTFIEVLRPNPKYPTWPSRAICLYSCECGGTREADRSQVKSGNTSHCVECGRAKMGESSAKVKHKELAKPEKFKGCGGLF